MGCDIHLFAEVKDSEGKFQHVKFTGLDDRNYGTFAFLAGVRNYSGVDPIAPARGFPDDASSYVLLDYEGWSCDAHTPSWLTIEELSSFDYDAEMEDRRVTRKTSFGWDGRCTCDPGEGKRMTWREFLGEGFMEDLSELSASGAHRVVFWFDN